MWLPWGDRRQLPKDITDLAIVPRAKSVLNGVNRTVRRHHLGLANLVSGLLSIPGSHSLLGRQPGPRGGGGMGGPPTEPLPSPHMPFDGIEIGHEVSQGEGEDGEA